MLHRAIATLRNTLRPHLGLSKDRLETLALIVVAMVSARTVNLSHHAAERPGSTLVASTYRRLQRFFQYVRLGQDWSAPLAARLAGLTGSWYLALDRTQWRIGSREVNFLVLAAVTRRFRVPLMWTVIPGAGQLQHPPAHRPDAPLPQALRSLHHPPPARRPGVHRPRLDGFLV